MFHQQPLQGLLAVGNDVELDLRVFQQLRQHEAVHLAVVRRQDVRIRRQESDLVLF